MAVIARTVNHDHDRAKPFFGTKIKVDECLCKAQIITIMKTHKFNPDTFLATLGEGRKNLTLSIFPKAGGRVAGS